MAEGVFRSLAKSNPRIGGIDSCGTGAYHISQSPNPCTMAVLRKNGIVDYDHGARQITREDFNEFDYIFAMDAWNLKDLQKMEGRIEGGGRHGTGQKTKAKVMLFGEFASPKGSKGRTIAEEVEDPYYGPDEGFEVAYEQVKRFSTNFLRDVVNQPTENVSS